MARKPRPRRDQGLPWRLLAHHADGNPRHITDEGCDFDELVAGRWIHIERMNRSLWWMDIGGVTVHVKADRDGRPIEVRVDGPGCYADAVEGCKYDLTRDDGAAGQESIDAEDH